MLSCVKEKLVFKENFSWKNICVRGKLVLKEYLGFITLSFVQSGCQVQGWGLGERGISLPITVKHENITANYEFCLMSLLVLQDQIDFWGHLWAISLSVDAYKKQTLTNDWCQVSNFPKTFQIFFFPNWADFSWFCWAFVPVLWTKIGQFPIFPKHFKSFFPNWSDLSWFCRGICSGFMNQNWPVTNFHKTF